MAGPDHCGHIPEAPIVHKPLTAQTWNKDFLTLYEQTNLDLSFVLPCTEVIKTCIFFSAECVFLITFYSTRDLQRSLWEKPVLQGVRNLTLRHRKNCRPGGAFIHKQPRQVPEELHSLGFSLHSPVFYPVYSMFYRINSGLSLS